MRTQDIQFVHRGKEYRITVLLATEFSELSGLLPPNDLVDACNKALIEMAKHAAIGRKRREARFVRIDLENPILAPYKDLLHKAAISAKASSKVSGVTTLEIPPAEEIDSST